MDVSQQIAHLDDNKGPQVIGAQAACLALAYSGVLGRFLSRRLARAGFWTDDWLTLLALLLYTATTIDGFICIWLGAGRHEATLSHPTAFSKVNISNRIDCEMSHQEPPGRVCIHYPVPPGRRRCEILCPLPLSTHLPSSRF